MRRSTFPMTSSAEAEGSKMLSGIPEGWSVKSVGQIAAVNMGQSPPSSVVNTDGDGLPFIQGNAEFGVRFPVPRQFAATCPKTADAGDILLSVRAPVGEVNVAPVRLCIGRGLAALRPMGSDREFLFQALGALAPIFARLSQGSTFEAINGTDLRAISLVLPPLEEQRRIAEVLWSVDEATAASEAIHKAALKAQQAAFSAFLASGNAHDSGHAIKGWTTGIIAGIEKLPPEWELARLVDVARLESGHTPDRKRPEYWQGGNIEWISLHDTQNLERADIAATEMRITEAGLANSSARVLPEGTVCFSRTATVGKCVIMAKPMATSQDFANFVCSARLNNRYLLHLMRWMQPVWKALASGSTHKTIYMPTFKALQIILPPREEQDRIVQTMDAFTAIIEREAQTISALRVIKQSVMSDLLSGRVRVPA